MSKYEELVKQLCPDGVEYKRVSDVCDISRGQVMSKDYIKDNAGDYPVYSSQTENNGELGKINTYMYDGEYLTWTTDGANAGTVFYRTGKFSVTNVCGLLKVTTSQLLVKFLYYTLSVEAPKYVNSGMGNPKLMSNVMGRIKVPVPPIEVQSEIVRILDSFTELTAELIAELTARKSQYEYYRAFLLSFNEDCLTKNVAFEIRSLEKCCQILDNKRKPITKSARKAGEYPYYGANGIQDYVADYILDGTFVLVGEDGSVMTPNGNPVVNWAEGKIWVNNHAHIISEIDGVLLRYLFHYLQTVNVKPLIHGNIPKLTGGDFRALKIPVPPISEQKRITEILDRFDALCNDISAGLPAEIEARQKQYEYYRDKLLTFKAVQ